MTPLEGAAVAAGVTASGVPFALAACHLAARAMPHRTTEWRTARRRAQHDRDLLRLARNSARKERTTMHRPARAPLAVDERSPDWCHRHGCPLSQCDPRH
ncbi:hypothetical protein KVH22_21775 [Streptomyces olivaceus]|uniref:hypothetical protein n=1 Tax=Streptomyces olivaceus TaxID=47716 RepID=UPI001CCFA612|nr:hypothetical protein [Streptomyces olivaceus]MBZ6258149.1 hypothetical protein [Streptomyces olivaceus]